VRLLVRAFDKEHGRVSGNMATCCVSKGFPAVTDTGDLEVGLLAVLMLVPYMCLLSCGYMMCVSWYTVVVV
jgi:hypothetical protein